jgi:hypothetical protein
LEISEPVLKEEVREMENLSRLHTRFGGTSPSEVTLSNEKTGSKHKTGMFQQQRRWEKIKE